MGALTENEIFAQMDESFKAAIDLCKRLGRGERNDCYTLLRAHLGVLENCFRQAGWWREDARWLSYADDPNVPRFQYDDTGIMSLIWVVSKAHESAGKWLREHHGNWKFLKLAQVLASGEKAANDLRHKATGRSGLILPGALPGPHRDTRPVQVIVPDGRKPH